MMEIFLWFMAVLGGFLMGWGFRGLYEIKANQSRSDRSKS